MKRILLNILFYSICLKAETTFCDNPMSCQIMSNPPSAIEVIISGGASHIYKIFGWEGLFFIFLLIGFIVILVARNVMKKKQKTESDNNEKK